MRQRNEWLVPARDPNGRPLRVVDPFGGGLLPANGAFRDLNNLWWVRRLQAGDVTRGTPPAPAMPAKTDENSRQR